MLEGESIAVVDAAGHTKIIGRREADRPAGKFCKGRRLDSEVDYLQFCHATAILDALRPEGVTHLDMPASAFRVWQALQEAQKR